MAKRHVVSHRSKVPWNAKPQPRVRWRRLLVGLTGLYLICLLGILALIYGPGERCWLTSLLLFGPTWVLAVPLFALGALWLVCHRGLWLLGVLVGAGLLLAGPVLGAAVPLARVVPQRSDGPRIRLVTWNVEGNAVSAEQLSRLLAEFRPDIVLLQECRAQVMATAAAEWQRHEHGGMCLLSQFPVRAVADRDRRDVWKKAGSGAIVRYTIEAPFGVFEVTNVHLETPREGFEDFLGGALRTGIKTLTAKNEQRYEEAALAQAWVRAGSSSARIVAGDFNTPPQSDLLRNGWPGYTNCFESAGFGLGHTKHTRTIGVRIDHVLASSAWRCRDATVVTGAEGSDHSPVMVELEWVGTPSP